ncbi:MTP-1 family protein [Paenibacillus glacialis]|uniref:DUF1861 domain-containing protein n=1 Tax=Paenibacillus glacialis TaxID=494026 RepID=A0A162M8J7_9BACL|nr:DUF1861 family protein [Paenibacillus glacialis]OAB40123.1 hypothetical protein PGLA_18365 [Paenibacillus glacialis]
MSFTQKETKTCATLLREYQQSNKTVRNPEKLTFMGVGDKDVYNITAPFEDEGEQVIAGRVESRDSEHSEIVFFVERDGAWIPREGAPILTLQDPFYTKIAGELVLGGVQIYPHPNPTKESIFSWRTVFYKGARIAELKPFFTGPSGMKDLRLVELIDGSIGVLTRPQGEKGGRGKIGFTRISSLKDLTPEVIEEAPLLEGQFIEEEWGGGNEIHLLNNGLLGILGHIACFDTELDRHYYSMVFVLDPETREFSDIRLIAVRAEFVPGVSKRPDLRDVVFSGGLVRNLDGTANLYVGLSDAEAHRLTMADPFISFE